MYDEKVRCVVCRRWYPFVYSKDDDGRAVYPRKHYLNTADGRKIVCPGVKKEGDYGQLDSRSG